MTEKLFTGTLRIKSAKQTYDKADKVTVGIIIFWLPNKLLLCQQTVEMEL